MLCACARLVARAPRSQRLPPARFAHATPRRSPALPAAQQGGAWGRWVGAGVLAGAALGAVTQLSAAQAHRGSDANECAEDLLRLPSDEQQTVRVFRAVSGSVVFITQLAGRRTWTQAEEVPIGTGSGFVWDEHGHIVTNHHVISSGSAVRVTIGGQEYPAKVVGVDRVNDIAVLKVQTPKPLTPLRLGSSGGLCVGQRAYAIGSPFGLDHTLTTGVVSGVGREVQGQSGRPIFNCIQTDAAMNPGNSGGPLVNSLGEVVGVNMAIFSPSGASSGVAFAVPIDTVKRSVSQILRHGRVKQPTLGLVIAPDQYRSQLEVEGVLVIRATSPSARISGIRETTRTARGLELGDVIVGLDGQPVRRQADIFRVLEAKVAGENVRLEVINPRTLQTRVVVVQLEDRDMAE